jgi:predicted transcriptional regulator
VKAKKKKVSEMTQKEILEELGRTLDELESIAPDVVGSLIKLSKSFYALSKDEKARELVMTDKDFRKDILELASATNDLERILFQVEEITRQKLEELEKKRDSEKKE